MTILEKTHGGVLAGLVAAAVLALHFAYEPSPARAEGPPGMHPPGLHAQLCRDADAAFVARIAFIGTKVGPSAEQSVDWDAFVAALREVHRDYKARCADKGQGQGPDARQGAAGMAPPEDPILRLQMLDREMTARAEAHRQIQLATANFMAVLPPGQQRALAEAMLPPALPGLPMGPPPL